MKLITLRGHSTKTCKKCGDTIFIGKKAWRVTSHKRPPDYYCKKCGDEIQI